MAEIFNGITDELQTISKLADRPEIPAAELKAKFDSDAITLKNAVNKLIELLNATIEDGNLSGQQNKIPTSNAVAQAISIAGGGDMLKSVYDSDGDNIVDDAKRLGGVSADQYLQKSGGTMTGALKVPRLSFSNDAVSAITPSSTDSSLIFNGDLRVGAADTGKYNLGTSGAKWKDLYLSGDARIDGALYLLSGAVMHNTVPETSDTYDLGSSSRKWRNLYLSDGVNASGTSIMNGIRPNANNSVDLGSTSYGWRNLYVGTVATSGGGKIQNTQSGEMYIHANSEANNAVFFGVRNSVWTLCPHVSGKVALGNSNFKWGQIYSTNSAISTSDENEKNTIESLDKEKASMFIMGVNPVSYKFNDGTSGRTHWGMISQDIEKLMNEKGMSSLDFAGFIKSPKTQRVETGKDENGDPIYEDKVIEGEYTYGLRYEEFIAPMIATIQYQQQKIEEQGKQIEDLTKRIEALEGGK